MCVCVLFFGGGKPLGSRARCSYLSLETNSRLGQFNGAPPDITCYVTQILTLVADTSGSNSLACDLSLLMDQLILNISAVTQQSH